MVHKRTDPTAVEFDVLWLRMDTNGGWICASSGRRRRTFVPVLQYGLIGEGLLGLTYHSCPIQYSSDCGCTGSEWRFDVMKAHGMSVLY